MLMDLIPKCSVALTDVFVGALISSVWRLMIQGWQQKDLTAAVSSYNKRNKLQNFFSHNCVKSYFKVKEIVFITSGTFSDGLSPLLNESFSL